MLTAYHMSKSSRHPKCLKFHPYKAQNKSNSLPRPKTNSLRRPKKTQIPYPGSKNLRFPPLAQKISNSLRRPNISPEQHHRVGPAIFLQPGDKPTGPGRHLHHCYHDQIIIVFFCLVCIVRSQLEILI